MEKSSVVLDEGLQARLETIWMKEGKPGRIALGPAIYRAIEDNDKVKFIEVSSEIGRDYESTSI